MKVQNTLIDFMRHKARRISEGTGLLASVYFRKEDAESIRKWPDKKAEKVWGKILDSKDNELASAPDFCPFCIFNGLDCKKCEYAAHHGGICESGNDDYTLIVKKMVESKLDLYAVTQEYFSIVEVFAVRRFNERQLRDVEKALHTVIPIEKRDFIRIKSKSVVIPKEYKFFPYDISARLKLGFPRIGIAVEDDTAWARAVLYYSVLDNRRSFLHKEIFGFLVGSVPYQRIEAILDYEDRRTRGRYTTELFFLRKLKGVQ